MSEKRASADLPEMILNEKELPIEEDTIDEDPESGNLLTPSEERKLLWKIDFRVVLALSLLLALSVIDRINIGNARVLGMDKELNLVGNRYSICLLMFFPSYALFEIPNNIMLVKCGVKNWVTFIAVSWGAVILGMGFVNTWQALAALRFLLGIFEAGIFPACIYVLSSWYPRYSLHKRMSFLYGVAIIGSAFGGVFAYALGLMNGLRGLSGWRWLFIIEGAVTMVIAFLVWPALSEFPDRAKWLTPRERKSLLTRLENDGGSAKTESLTLKHCVEYSKDWITWATTYVFFCNVVPTYGLAFFVPTIIRGLGYSGLQASLHSAPPYAAALGTLAISSYLGDKYHRRTPLIVFLAIMTIVGIAISQPGPPNNVRYLGIHLAIMGTQANSICILTFSQNNVVGSAKRSFSSALNIAGGAVAGIMGSTVFRQQDAPSYTPGLYAVIGLQVTMIITVLLLALVFYRRNKHADREGLTLNGIVGWRYTL